MATDSYSHDKRHRQHRHSAPGKVLHRHRGPGRHPWRRPAHPASLSGRRYARAPARPRSGLQFLRRGAADGEKGLYITLSETAAELRTVAASHGWSLKGVEVFELVTEEGLSPESQQSILHPSEVELGETTRGVMAAVERLKPKRVVFDSLSEMRLLAQNPLRYRRQVLALKRFLRQLRLHRPVAGRPQCGHRRPAVAQHRARRHQRWSKLVDQYGPERRHLRVVKMRGIRFRGGEHDFNLDTGGISVLSAADRGRASQHGGKHQRQHRHGRARPVAGRRPRARHQHLVQRPVRRRQDHHGPGLRVAPRCSAASGPPTTCSTRAWGPCWPAPRALGMSVDEYLENGQLQIHTLDPAEVSPGEFAHMVRSAVEDARRADRGDRQPQCLPAGDAGRQAPAAADARAADLPEPARHRHHPDPRPARRAGRCRAPMST